MTTRHLSTWEEPRELDRLAQSLLAAEAVAARPGGVLWIESAWISPVPLIDNTAGDFQGIDPDWPRTLISADRWIETVASRGTTVHIAFNTQQHNSAMKSRLESLIEQQLPIRIHEAPNLHEKCIITPRFYWTGSMNLTFSGLRSSQTNTVTITTDPQAVMERNAYARQRWGGPIDA